MTERRGQASMRAAVTALEDSGWKLDGATRTQTVRIPTMRAPVFGGAGGELRTLGGRVRLKLPNTDLRVTVGPQTTCFYRMEAKTVRPVFGKPNAIYGAADLRRVRTKDLDEVKRVARTAAGPL